MDQGAGYLQRSVGCGDVGMTFRTFKIEDGIPLPPKALNRGSLQDCMNELQIGQSFLHEKCTLRSGRTYCSVMGRRFGKKFTCAPEGGALRIWRVE